MKVGINSEELLNSEPPKEKVQELISLYNHGQFDEVLSKAKPLASLFPRTIVLHNLVAAANSALKNLDQAIESFNKVLELNPEDAMAYFNIGTIFSEKEEFDTAIKNYQKCLSIKPNHAEAYDNMGSVLKVQGKLTTAIEQFTQAINLKPNFAQAHYNLGVVLQETGNSNAAIESHKKALEINPSYFKAYNNMGNALKDEDELDAAIESYEQAIKIKPEYAEAYYNMGIVLNDKGEVDAAINSYKKALKINPEYAEAYNNMGNALKEKGEVNAAIESYNLALKIKPDYAEAYYNMGIALNDKGELDAAIDNYNEAIKINPENADPYFGQSLTFLTKADFINGWSKYEWRWKTTLLKPGLLRSGNSKWHPDQAGRVLVWSEQGIGDVIMFSSTISELYQQAEQLIIQIDERLISLFSRSFPEDIIYYPNGEKVPEAAYDTHIPFGSLPMHFRPNLESFRQTSETYLKANKKLSFELRENLKDNDCDYIVGLTWRGGTKKNSIPRNKAVDLIKIAQVLNKNGVKIINLQYGDTDDECKKLKTDYGITVQNIPEVDNFSDIDGLAALVDACDHVVSTDNLTVHIAGALGKKTTVFLPFSADWRWGVKREDSYWHSSLRLLRQEKISDWSLPLEKLDVEFDFRDVKLAANRVDQTIGG